MGNGLSLCHCKCGLWVLVVGVHSAACWPRFAVVGVTLGIVGLFHVWGRILGWDCVVLVFGLARPWFIRIGRGRFTNRPYVCVVIVGDEGRDATSVLM